MLPIRAANYSYAIKVLLMKRQEKILRLNKNIEELVSKVLEGMQKKNNVIPLIQERLRLIEQKNAICDQKTLDSKDNFFAPLLQNLLQREHKNDTVSTPQVIKEQDKNKPNNIAENFIRNIKKLTSERKNINNYSSADTLSQYLISLASLRLKFINLPKNFLSSKELDCFKTQLTLSVEIKLYADALEQGNLEQIKILLPYCNNQVDMTTYSPAIFDWIFKDARYKYIDDKKIFDKKLQVFDYLHENCGIFNAFIYIGSIFLFECKNTYTSMMHLAYSSRNPLVFSALLRYGANPEFVWIKDKNGNCTSPMDVIVKDRLDTEFYVNELIRYGVTLKTTTINKYFINNVVKFSSAFKDFCNNTRSVRIDNIKNINSDITINCAFLQFVYDAKNYNTASVNLYIALINHSSLESLVVALPYIANYFDVTSLWFTNSKVGGLTSLNRKDGVNIKEDGSCLNLTYIIPEDKGVEIWVGGLISAITNKLSNISSEALNMLEKKILKLIDNIINNKAHPNPFLMYHYTALNIIATFRSNLNEEQQIKLIENFALAGQVALDNANIIYESQKKVVELVLSQGKSLHLSDIEGCKLERQELNYMAVNNFLNAVKVTKQSCYPDLKKLPSVQRCLDEATKIIKNSKSLSENRRTQIESEEEMEKSIIKAFYPRQKMGV